MSFIKRSGDSKRSQWPALMASRLIGKWNKEQSSLQLQVTRLKPLTQVSTDNAGFRSCPLQIPTPRIISQWEEKISSGMKRRPTVFEKIWKSYSEPHHPKSDFSRQRGLNFLIKSWQSSSLSGRRKEHCRTFLPLRWWKSPCRFSTFQIIALYTIIQHCIQLSDTQDGSVNVLGLSICYMAASDCGKLRSK